MGLPVYMDYYTVHDDTNNKIGFVPNNNSSNKGFLKSGTRPTRVLESTDPEDPRVSVWSWIISAFLVLASICCWIQLFFDAERTSRGKTDAGSFCCAATVFIVCFGTIVYLWVQPLINDFIIDDEDAYEGGMY